MLPRVPPNMPAPPIKWWGNVFYRVWKDWEQLVVVIRVPWWRGPEARLYGSDASLSYPREQLMLSWRVREGWRSGWRAV